MCTAIRMDRTDSRLQTSSATLAGTDSFTAQRPTDEGALFSYLVPTIHLALSSMQEKRNVAVHATGSSLPSTGNLEIAGQAGKAVNISP